MDNEAKFRPEILRSLFDQGFMGMEIDEERGGSGLSFTCSCLVVEEISRIDPSVSIMVDIHNTLTNNAVRFWGSPDLQDRWLPRLAADTVSSFCLSEAGSGSDAFAMKTIATPNSDSSAFTIDGANGKSKMFKKGRCLVLPSGRRHVIIVLKAGPSKQKW